MHGCFHYYLGYKFISSKVILLRCAMHSLPRLSLISLDVSSHLTSPSQPHMLHQAYLAMLPRMILCVPAAFKGYHATLNRSYQWISDMHHP